MFNDDIQGTAATVLAGLYGALKVQGKGPEALSQQKFVVCGAGSAASGVLLTVRNAITRRWVRQHLLFRVAHLVDFS